MHTPVRKSLFSASLAAALLTMSSHAFALPLTQEVVNARQESQIWTTFALNPYLRHSNLQVKVLDGKATLSGKVAEGVNKELAKQIALGVGGVRDVDNQIVVDTDYAPPPANGRSYADMVDDATISTAIQSKLAWSKYSGGLVADVATLSGKVTLTGSADDAAAKTFAGRVALGTRGVESVNNQLVVGSRPDTAASRAATATGTKLADSWITTKVKSTFLYSNYVDSFDISVTTLNGIVTLNGKLGSGNDRALAVELARNVRGVKRVQAAGLTF
ncbi:BON domain-containing protein [Chitinimonas sp. BJYL2]|uniref:BON domain-containing protein n=1 Tax=Chitinimonas sp. BJYL2 TaxID=2976696 RepID=UPI0022B47155|nr:BON domain-containing protein [Chitinimonas sp. BJYL2]